MARCNGSLRQSPGLDSRADDLATWTCNVPKHPWFQSLTCPAEASREMFETQSLQTVIQVPVWKSCLKLELYGSIAFLFKSHCKEDILGVASQPLLDLPSTCKPFNKVVAGKATLLILFLCFATHVSFLGLRSSREVPFCAQLL